MGYRTGKSSPQTNLGSVAGLCCAAIIPFLAGCSGRHKDLIPSFASTAAFAPPAPPFLSGPAAVLLTNPPGYSAHVVLSNSLDAYPAKSASGELLARSGKLLFAPEPEKPHKGSVAGRFSFIWDVRAVRGYLLSEALQAYAPISAGLAASNVIDQSSGRLAKIEGHACEEKRVLVQATDGSTPTFEVARALDLSSIPLRLSAGSNSALWTITLSKVRIKEPPAELFEPPDGFTRYSSPEAMMTELIIRQHNLKRAPSAGPEPIYLDRSGR